MEPGRRPRWDGVLAALVAALPVALAVGAAVDAPDFAHDMGAVRVLGLGYAGPFRGLDALAAGALLALPFGTESFRASLVGAVAVGLAGFALYVLARELLGRLAETAHLGLVVAATASLTVTLSPAWQLEAGVVGGGALGGLLALAPLAALGLDASRYEARLPRAALLAGLAFAYAPFVGLAALGGIVPLLVLGEKPSRRALLRSAGALGLGLTPLLYGLARARVSVFALGAGTRGSPWSDELGGGHVSPVPFLHDQVGWLALVLAGVGAGLALWAPASRRAALALVGLLIPSLAAVALGAPAGPVHFAPSALVAVAALLGLAAVGMQSAVLAVARAEVPFARASAAMVVVLELTFPAVAADDAGLRAAARAEGVRVSWDELVVDKLPAESVLLLRTPALVRHLTASRARGALRGDVTVLALRDLASRAALRELSRDADLAPLFRDMALRGAPAEYALASLSATRDLYVEYDRHWEHALARHLVPDGAFDRFAPEPHGRTDRKRALAAFLPERQALAKRIAGPRDEAACALTATLLRARLVALAAAGEHDLLVPAVDDLRAFAPDDPLANEIVRRVASTRGTVSVDDLPD